MKYYLLIFLILSFNSYAIDTELISILGENVTITGERYPNNERDRAILLVHGFSGNYLTFAQQAELYHSLGFDVWTINLRGHGVNNITTSVVKYNEDDYKIKKMLEVDIPLTIEHIYNTTGKKIIYVGHSVGALIGLSYASGENALTDDPDEIFQLSQDRKKMIDKLIIFAPIIKPENSPFFLRKLGKMLKPWVSKNKGFLHLGLKDKSPLILYDGHITGQERFGLFKTKEPIVRLGIHQPTVTETVKDFILFKGEKYISKFIQLVAPDIFDDDNTKSAYRVSDEMVSSLHKDTVLSLMNLTEVGTSFFLRSTHNIEIPILSIMSTNDKFVPPKKNLKALKKIINPRYLKTIKIKKANHSSMLRNESLEQIKDQLLSFIGNNNKCNPLSEL